jgi:hypothetical protein|uniref:Uncharacterized protein n=2 Tax=Zea mays TaxID=4577 RepID=B6UHG4_MAIZE|nr:hypothetical protein [Zea mays]
MGVAVICPFQPCERPVYNRAKAKGHRSGFSSASPPSSPCNDLLATTTTIFFVALFFESLCSRRVKSCSRFFDWFTSRRSLLGHSSSFESSEALVAAVRILALVTEEMRDHTPGPLDMRLLSIAPRVFSRGSNNSLPLHL